MHKELYNSAIANRRVQYERYGHRVDYYEQQNSLPAFKEVWTEYKQLGSQTLQATLKRSQTPERSSRIVLFSQWLGIPNHRILGFWHELQEKRITTTPESLLPLIRSLA
jgi:hypothetical protein